MQNAPKLAVWILFKAVLAHCIMRNTCIVVLKRAIILFVLYNHEISNSNNVCLCDDQNTHSAELVFVMGRKSIQWWKIKLRRSKQRQEIKTKAGDQKGKEIKTVAEDENKSREIKTRAGQKGQEGKNKSKVTKTKASQSKQRLGDQRRHSAYLACEVGRRSGSHARPDI